MSVKRFKVQPSTQSRDNQKNHEAADTRINKNKRVKIHSKEIQILGLSNTDSTKKIHI